MCEAHACSACAIFRFHTCCLRLLFMLSRRTARTRAAGDVGRLDVRDLGLEHHRLRAARSSISFRTSSAAGGILAVRISICASSHSVGAVEAPSIANSTCCARWLSGGGSSTSGGPGLADVADRRGRRAPVHVSRVDLLQQLVGGRSDVLREPAAHRAVARPRSQCSDWSAR